MAKRGLFQSIFGGKSEKSKDFHAYKLLSSWESTFVPYSGNMWDINTVRSAVDAFARRASTAQPRHVRQSAETTVAVNDYIDRILQFRPNPYMTAADFYYKLAAQYKVYNNAIAYPVFDETGRLTAIYPINAQYFELLEYMGTLLLPLHLCDRRNVHLRIFPSYPRPAAFPRARYFRRRQQASRYRAQDCEHAQSEHEQVRRARRGYPGYSESLERRQDGGLKPPPRRLYPGQSPHGEQRSGRYRHGREIRLYAYHWTRRLLSRRHNSQYVKEEIYDYLGVSKEIVENTATPQQEQAFYSGEIAPFFRRLSQAFSNVLFTEREFGYGNRIVFSANSVQFATLPEKVTAAKFLTEIGAATLDQILTMFDMPTIGGEEGARRVQTLNMVNAKLADKYQTGTDGGGGNTPPDDTTPPGEPTGKEEV